MIAKILLINPFADCASVKKAMLPLQDDKGAARRPGGAADQGHGSVESCRPPHLQPLYSRMLAAHQREGNVIFVDCNESVLSLCSVFAKGTCTGTHCAIFFLT